MVVERKMTSACGMSCRRYEREWTGEMGGTDHFDAFAGATTEVDRDDAVGAPFAFACEAVYADEIGDGGARASTLEMEPVERGRRVWARGGDTVGWSAVDLGRRGVWTGRHGGTWCRRGRECVWKERDGGRALLVSWDGCGGLGRAEADKVFGSEEGAEEGDKVFVGDFGEGVVVDDGACVGVACVDDPGCGHAETGPDFAVFCAYAGCFEGVAKMDGVGVAAEGGDEHGLDLACCGYGGGELGEECEDMTRCAASCSVDGLGAVDSAWDGVRV